MALKGLFSILAIILIVSGFFIIVLGYSNNAVPAPKNDTDVPDDNPPDYHFPENPPGWHPSNIPHDPVPMSIFGVTITATDFIGILLICAGMVFAVLGGSKS